MVAGNDKDYWNIWNTLEKVIETKSKDNIIISVHFIKTVIDHFCDTRLESSNSANAGRISEIKQK